MWRRFSRFRWRAFPPLPRPAFAGVAISFVSHFKPALVLCQEPLTVDPQLVETSPHPLLGSRINGLTEYSLQDVAKHKQKGISVWVTYREGVYDVTDFVSRHPGGDKILLGAGGPVDPFWRLYGQHNLPHIGHMLEAMRIGNLRKEDYEKMQSSLNNDPNDPYRFDPQRHPGLQYITERPACAETTPSLLCETYITPNDLFFVRHHFPVPDPEDPSASAITVSGHGLSVPVTVTVEELKTAFPQHEITAAIQCTGNRRLDLKSVKNTPAEVKGLPWTIGAISNATWKGPLLSDVLRYVYGSKHMPLSVKHVQFQGRDGDGTQSYGASVPVEKVMDPRGDVILAHSMNGKQLPLDHGYPIRVVVPGAAGCRSVKWVKSIVCDEDESASFWQREDYKSFSPSQGWEGLDYSSAPAVQATPVQSAICDVQIDPGSVNALVKGYAFSGGGNAVIRVDVSGDGGKTWVVADLMRSIDAENPDPKPEPYRRTWGWCLWSAVVDLPDGTSEAEIVVKAVDEGCNCQPDNPAGVWNVRGILNNSWHRLKVSRG